MHESAVKKRRKFEFFFKKRGMKLRLKLNFLRGLKLNFQGG